ncbi:hypothetical protein Tco_0058061 [Tanacetum coccineum]
MPSSLHLVIAIITTSSPQSTHHLNPHQPPTPFPRPTHHRDHNSTAVITSTASPPSWSSQPRHHRHHHRSHDPPWVRLARWSVTQEGAFRLSQHQPGALGCMVPPKACLVEHSTKGCVGFIEAADECVGFMAAATGVCVCIVMGTKSAFGSGEHIRVRSGRSV